MTETNNSTKTVIKLDAANKRLGRLASEIAVLLQGKDRADYAPNKVAPVEVVVSNINALEITEAKKDKIYESYSGYPGGLKRRTLSQVVERKGVEEILRKAVNGMLPKNKLQKLRMQNLTIENN